MPRAKRIAANPLSRPDQPNPNIGFPHRLAAFRRTAGERSLRALRGEPLALVSGCLFILLEQIIRAETVQWLLHFLVLFALTNDRIAMLFAAMQMVASGRFCCRSRLMNA